MAYLTFERSAHGGAPVELYRFACGAQKWLYTSGQDVITYQAETYEPQAIARAAIGCSDDQARASLEIRTARDLPLVAFMAAPPIGVVNVTIYRRHLTDPDAEWVTLWKGRVLGVKLIGGSEAVFQCESVIAGLSRAGLRARYSILCRHALYSPACGVQKASYRVNGTVDAIAGLTLQIAAAGSKPDGYFAGGVLECATKGARMITAHTGAAVTIMAAIPGLQAGDAVSLYAGCDHTLATCKGRFGNIAAFGGFPWLPTKNPFSGDAIV